MAQHWIIKYLALKHEKGGRGPEAVDCWGLLFLFYRDELGILLPEYPGIPQSPVNMICGAIEDHKRISWDKTENPKDGAAVALAQGRALHHVGIWATADGGKIVHCYGSQGIVADTLRSLKVKGFRTIEFYHHHLWRSS